MSAPAANPFERIGRAAAKLAECNPPSPFTRREVVGEYVARARENGRRAEPDLDVDLCGCGAPGHDDADGEGVRCDDCRATKLKCSECGAASMDELCFRCRGEH